MIYALPHLKIRSTSQSKIFGSTLVRPTKSRSSNTVYVVNSPSYVLPKEKKQKTKNDTPDMHLPKYCTFTSEIK